MNKDKSLNIVLIFTGAYLLFFALYGLFKGNKEFVYYGIIVLVIFVLLVRYHKTLQLSFSSLVGLSFAQLIHVLGGNLYIHGIRLYDTWLIENIVKYDNFVHFVTSFILVLAVYDMVKNYLHEKMHYNKIVLYLLMVFIVLGIGAINEIMELGAVLFFNAGDRVGDYLNNAFDLVFNFLGSSVAMIWILSKKEYLVEHKQRKMLKKKI
jgi:uncharacterized membrane protein YjdF